MKLTVVVASIREGRAGDPIARWFVERKGCSLIGVRGAFGAASRRQHDVPRIVDDQLAAGGLLRSGAGLLAHGSGVDYSVSQTADRRPPYVSSSERSAVAWAERSGSSAPGDCDRTPVLR